jgi:hypothetical protein
MPSLDSGTFDTSGLRFERERDPVRAWFTSGGDGVWLYYFALKPDIGADLKSLDSVRTFFRSAAAAAGAAIIEVETVPVDRCIAVRKISKVPQQLHGMTCLGSITLPFRDFSFVIKAQCKEQGVTGARDAAVVDEAIGDGRVTIDPELKMLRGWMQDPYDPTLRDGFHRNLSEAEEYDGRFPEHPLSRLRPILARLQRTLRVANEVSHSHPYVFPP